MRKKNFYSVWTVAICFATLFLTTNTMAQSGQIQGSNSSSGDLYQERDDIGVGSADNPQARIHIFNGLDLPNSNEAEIDYGNNTNAYPPPIGFKHNRPFLITGKKTIMISSGSGITPPHFETIDKVFFTVNHIGNVGVGIFNPFTKMHLHHGIFTFTSGNINEPSANWQIHGNDNAFAIKDQLANKYHFWINKNNGFVGIGTTTPDEKFHVEDGNILINNGSLIIKGNNSATTGTNEITLNSNGYIRAREIKVDLDNIPHPDYVFKENYNLMPLAELKTFVETNNHLPNVKSEKEFKTEGSYALGEMNLKLLEKVEELTLYILQLEERLSKVELNGGVR